MSLLKIPLLLLSAISYDMAIDHPTPPHPEARIAVMSIRERLWKHAVLPCSLFMKGTAYLTAMAESTVILGSLYYNDARRSPDTISIVLDALGPTEASQLTLSFVIGACLVIAGGIIRVKCFRALGPYFTFTQCIRKDHKLVTTGPYAVVRHPAYASMFMCILGSCIIHGSPGAWLRVSGVLGVPWVRAVFVGWWLLMAASVMTLFSRPTDEDRFLAERFGKEWEDWAERVKYKLVPFVY